MFKNSTITNESNVSLITKETSLEGTINTGSNLRVDGKFKGTINSTSKIVVGENGVLDGNVSCKEISVYGRLKGTVKTSLIKVNGGSFVDGNISYENMSVAEGSEVKGVLNVLPQKSKFIGIPKKESQE
jgi:cytoskeletal protein CcmA (bactofilin family)